MQEWDIITIEEPWTYKKKRLPTCPAPPPASPSLLSLSTLETSYPKLSYSLESSFLHLCVYN